MQYRFVAIEGTIGAGKTTLAEIIARQYNARFVAESFENNPFLPGFYEDPARHAFALELFFLAERYHQLSDVTGSGLFHDFIVSDYYLEKSLIFARNNLSEEEFGLFHRLYSIMYGKLPKPDLLIYLYVSIDRLLENIRKRNRDYELKITDDYLGKIQQTYLDHFSKTNDYRIVLLDYGSADFSKNPEKAVEIYRLFSTDFPFGVTRISL